MSFYDLTPDNEYSVKYLLNKLINNDTIIIDEEKKEVQKVAKIFIEQKLAKKTPYIDNSPVWKESLILDDKEKIRRISKKT